MNRNQNLAHDDLLFAARMIEAGDLDRAMRYAALATQVLAGEGAAPRHIVNGVTEELRPAAYVPVSD